MVTKQLLNRNKKIETKQRRRSFWNRLKPTLGNQIDYIRVCTEKILRRAITCADDAKALMAIDRRLKQIELQAKLEGRFQQPSDNQIILKKISNSVILDKRLNPEEDLREICNAFAESTNFSANVLSNEVLERLSTNEDDNVVSFQSHP